MGLFDSLFGGDEPSRRTPDIDPGYYKQMSQAGKEMGEFDPNKYAAQKVAQAKQGQQLLGPAQKYGPGDIQSAAIASKAQKGFGESLGQTQRQAQYGAIGKQQENIARSSGYSAKLNSIMVEMKKRRMEEEANNLAIRAQVLSSIFSTAGMAGGMAMGGAFSGKKTGGNVGPDGKAVSF